MKSTTIRVAVALLLLTAGGAYGQKQTLTVRQGDAFDYALAMTVEATQSMQGQEMKLGIGADGTTRIRAGKVAPKQIAWSFEIPMLHMSSTGQMMGDMDSTMSVPPAPFVTDRKGKIVTQPTLAELMPGVQGMNAATAVDQYFSPALTRSLKVGDTWETTAVDSTESMGMTIYTTRVNRYTYDGVVDTLGAKSVRIRNEATKFTLEGTGQVGGMDVSMDGDGTSVSVTYYALADGLLVNASTDAEMNAQVRVNGGGQQPMLIPLTTRTQFSLNRK